MELSDQVCSLELAKKLKELKFKQTSYFIWFKLKENNDWSLSEAWQIDDNHRFDEISSFTSSELSELLPSVIYGESASESSYSLNIYRPNNHWHISYTSGHKTKIVYYAETLADCMAGILICLITMGIIKND